MLDKDKVAHQNVLAAIRMQRLRERKSKSGVPDGREIDRCAMLTLRRLMEAGGVDRAGFELVKKLSGGAIAELRRGNVDMQNPETRAVIRRRFGVAKREKIAAPDIQC